MTQTGSKNKMTIQARQQPTARAFTLLEVLIATMVFAIVMASITTIFYAALRLRNHSAGAIEESLPLQRATEIIRRDLSGLVPYQPFQSTPGSTTPSSGSTSSSSTSGSSSGTSSSSMLDTTTLLPGQASPDFFTTTGLLDMNTPWADVQMVAYVLADSTNGTPGKDLMRSVNRNLYPVNQEQAPQQWLLSGVQNLTFTYYDGTSWLDTWDSTSNGTNGLPLAIKVQIELLSSGSLIKTQDPIELVVPITVQMRTNLTSSTSSSSTGSQ